MTSAINTSLDFEQLAHDHLLSRKGQFICIVGSDTTILWASPGAAHYGIDPVGQSLADLVHPDDLAPASRAFNAQVMAANWKPSKMAEGTVLLRVTTPTGDVPFEVGGRWVCDDRDEQVFVATLVDVTTRNGMNVALQTLAAGKDAEESARAITAAAHGYGGVRGAQMLWVSGGIVHTAGDLDGDVPAVEDAWPGLAGIDAPTILALPPASDWCYGFPFSSGDERLGTLIAWGVGKPPQIEFAASIMEPLLDLASLAVIRSRQLGNLNHRATTDHVTGLLNRHAFFYALDQAVERSAVIYVDLDGFKTVNDRFGHTLGDRLLLAVAKRLTAAATEGGMVGRLGGDEFVIACIDATEDEVEEAAEAVRRSLNQTIVVEGHEIVSGASLGVAYSENPILGIELIDAADQALLVAKAHGKGDVHMVNVGNRA